MDVIPEGISDTYPPVFYGTGPCFQGMKMH
jgi:hypothetical protein